MRKIKYILGMTMMVLCVNFLSLGIAAAVLASDKKSTQILTIDEIERLGKAYISQQLSWDDFEVAVEYHGKDAVLPAGNLNLDFRVGGSTVQIGRIPLSLNIMVDGVFKKRIRLTSFVTAYYQAVKTRQALRRDHILTADDVVVKRELVSYLTTRAATRLEDVIGFKILRNLKSGDVVTFDMVVKPPLVKRGDRIRLLAQKGFMRITVLGIAREKGFKGDFIRVENLESKRIVYGRVVDSNTVQVEF